MLRNYLATALRSLAQNRLHAAINIGGLALGLAACLLILLFVRDELSYEDWLPNAERIARLEGSFDVPGREKLSFAQAPGPAKAPLEKDFSSDVVRAVRILPGEVPVRAGQRQFADTVSYVDPGFFQVFDLPMVQGEREGALQGNTKLLLSREMASKYFGDASPLGKVLTLDNKTDYTVVGVFEDLPENTHLDLDFIALFDPQRYVDRPWIAERWTSTNTYTYALFRSADAIDRVDAELPGFVARNVQIDIPGISKAQMAKMLSFDLVPVPDIHLHSHRQNQMKPGGDIATVVAFSAIATLILLVACINFVNLATARSMKRAREVAMRKVVGATRGQLIVQHLGEAVLTAALALLLAIALVELALAPFNAFVHKQLSLDFAGDPALFAIAAGLVAVVGLLGGLYPAIYLSRFRPARVLKANQSAATGSPRFRSALVVFQFAISIGLIICTAVVTGQTIYARTIDLGFRPADKLVVEALSDMPSREVDETLKKEIGALPGVRGLAFSSERPPHEGQNNNIFFTSAVPGDESLLAEMVAVDFDFFTVYGLKSLAGRLFSADFPGDVPVLDPEARTELRQAIVVNETFVAKLGIADWRRAIGKVLWMPVQPLSGGDRLARTTIVGVLPDIQVRSVRMEIPPLYYVLDETDPEERSFDFLTVAIEPGRLREVQAGIAQIWSRLVPGAPLRTSLLDETLAAQYDGEEQRAQVFGAFAVFAVLIACLGLFGLASFAAERRTKEIGLRKVMGASVHDVVRLLVWQFSKPVLVANLIAWPVAFYFMSRWLDGFRYAIDLTAPLVLFAVFGGAGLLALAIAWGTVAGHAAGVARANPIRALRCE
jgi:putative ABC transport system permease protein